MSKERGNGLLCVWTDINPAIEEEFNTWYNQEHISERVLEVPGFLSARRYACVDGEPKYLAAYELEEPSVLQTDAYKEVAQRRSPGTQKLLPNFSNTTRNIYQRILEAGRPPAEDAEYLLTVRLGVAPENDALFNAWYNEDHIPALSSVPGVHYARRFRAVEGKPTYLATYEMDSPDVMESDAWAKARDHGRTAQVRPLFGEFQRGTYKLIFSMSK